MADSSYPTMSMNPLAQAEAIIRSASGQVDWTREPITDRERRIRARWIERQMGEALGRIVLRTQFRALQWASKVNGTNGPASDITQAARESEVLSRLESAERDADEYAEIGDELDEEAA